MWLRLCMLALLASFGTGCGTVVPRISEVWDRDYPGKPYPLDNPTPPISASGQIEYEVKQNIYCELRRAVQYADRYLLKDNTTSRELTSKLLPDDWGAAMSLSFQVDESATLAPSLSLITPLPDQQSRSLGFGGTLSSTATRTDKFNSFFTIKYLRDNSGATINKICEGPNQDPFRKDLHIEPAQSSMLVQGLGLKTWLLDALIVNQGIPSYGTPSVANFGPNGRRTKASGDKDPSLTADGQDTISIEIKIRHRQHREPHPVMAAHQALGERRRDPVHGRTHANPRSDLDDRSARAPDRQRQLGAADRSGSGRGQPRGSAAAVRSLLRARRARGRAPSPTSCAVRSGRSSRLPWRRPPA